MTTLFASILATALVAQIQGGTIQGKVVDDQGKPVADAQVVFFAARHFGGGGDPVEVQTKSDAGGQFRIAFPPLRRATKGGVHVWAYRPGSAIASVPIYLPPFDLVLRKPQPKTVKVEGPDGRPVAGAIVSPRVILDASVARIADMPATLESGSGRGHPLWHAVDLVGPQRPARHCSHAPRPTRDQRGQVVRGPSPAGYACNRPPNCQNRTGPDLDERPLYLRLFRCSGRLVLGGSQ